MHTIGDIWKKLRNSITDLQITSAVIQPGLHITYAAPALSIVVPLYYNSSQWGCEPAWKQEKVCVSTLKTFWVVNWTSTNQNLNAPVRWTWPEASPSRFPVSTWKRGCSERMLNNGQKHTEEKCSKALWNCLRWLWNTYQPTGQWNSNASTEN